jgi:hypothetical protein
MTCCWDEALATDWQAILALAQAEDLGPSGDCTTDAINACLDLQNCCRAILVNPVFFQSCNSVVLACNEQRCREVLDGYSTYAPCRPEPEPDGGVGGGSGEL